jgi:hypothetical protein
MTLESRFRFLGLQSRHEAQIVIRSRRNDLEAGTDQPKIKNLKFSVE